MAEADDRSQINLQLQQRMGEIVASRDFDRFSEVLADDLVDHDPAPGQPAGWQGIAWFWKGFTTAFPDLALHPLVVEATDHLVTAVFDVTGTHTGDFQGHAATGKTFRVRGIQVARCENGRITERYGSTDQVGLMEQLGLG